MAGGTLGIRPTSDELGLRVALSRVARNGRARQRSARPFFGTKETWRERGQWQTSRLCCAASAQAALTTTSETLPSAEERRAEAAAAESLAASGAGAVAMAVAKTAP